MQTADFNPDDFSNQSEADKQLLVRFMYKPVENRQATREQGVAVVEEMAFVEVRIPGQRNPCVMRRATLEDKRRFAPQYEAFQKRVEMPSEGTPLAEWPVVTRSQVEELAFFSIKTVEQLASVSDTNISKRMGGYGLREKAVKWLEQRDQAVSASERADMQERISGLEQQIGELTKVNAEQSALVDRLLSKVGDPDSKASASSEAASAPESVPAVHEEAAEAAEQEVEAPKHRGRRKRAKH